MAKKYLFIYIKITCFINGTCGLLKRDVFELVFHFQNWRIGSRLGVTDVGDVVCFQSVLSEDDRRAVFLDSYTF